MKKIKNLFITAIIVSLAFGATSCKKKGCIDSNANNFNSDAKKDDGTCTYPVITLSPTGDGDVTGGGGSASSTTNWSNSLTKAELNMDMTATSGGGSFNVVVKDADGNVVINETLTVTAGDDSKTICSQAGTSGTWTVTVTLTNFSGDGSYSLSQGC